MVLKRVLAGLAVLMAVCVGIYASLAPVGSIVLGPGCALKALTGLSCPGCGGTRCVSFLAHGDIVQAIGQNALLALVGIPLFIWLCFALVRFAMFGVWRFPNPHPTRLTVGLLAFIFGFMILRNLPWQPFAFLAPDPIEQRK